MWFVPNPGSGKKPLLLEGSPPVWISKLGKSDFFCVIFTRNHCACLRGQTVNCTSTLEAFADRRGRGSHNGLFLLLLH